VRDSCEKIQHLGARKDETGTRDEPDDEKILDQLEKIISQAKTEFADVERVLKRFYDDTSG
jgi:osomolarity two-component system phosphorelay intermediate protein YPD1